MEGRVIVSLRPAGTDFVPNRIELHQGLVFVHLGLAGRRGRSAAEYFWPDTGDFPEFGDIVIDHLPEERVDFGGWDLIECLSQGSSRAGYGRNVFRRLGGIFSNPVWIENLGIEYNGPGRSLGRLDQVVEHIVNGILALDVVVKIWLRIYRIGGLGLEGGPIVAQVGFFYPEEFPVDVVGEGAGWILF